MLLSQAHRVLLVGKEDAEVLALKANLEDRGFAVHCRSCRRPALDALKKHQFDVILLRACGPGEDGLFTLAHAEGVRDSAQFIVLGEDESVESAVISMRLGAFDYLGYSTDFRKILLSIQRALERTSLYRQVGRLRRERRDGSPIGIVGTSPAMHRVLDLVERVAPTLATVLLTGETGTGKEVTARAIHRLSNRSAGPFVPVSCAALPETLLESELFGHRKGSFTGANADRPGLLENAKGGTIFLDEIETLTPLMQGKLLRAVEERTIQRVGASHDIPVDFRLLVATNLDLIQQVKLGEFREDLYFRLNVFPIDLPPLRERRTDIPLLARHFCDEFAARDQVPCPKISTPVMNRLMNYEWPGNVRELRNCLERAFIMAREGTDLVVSVPIGNGKNRCESLRQCLEMGWSLKQMEKEYILEVIRHTEGHRNRAAKILGIDRRTLYRKLEMLEEEEEVPASSRGCSSRGCGEATC